MIAGRLTREQALSLMGTGWWMGAKDYDIALFQLSEDRLCMPFAEFHASVSRALKRPVYTHEFRDMESLRAELLGQAPAPTLGQILDRLPVLKDSVQG